jgi:hypothetical protein
MKGSGSDSGSTGDTRIESGPTIDSRIEDTTIGRTDYLPNYLAPAVIVTFICCMPLGAVALIYAARVNGKQIAGQWEEARKASESARLWCWIAFGVGIVFWTFYILLIITIMVLQARGR